MPGGVSREQIDRAKQVGILDYILAHEPSNVRQVGSAHYLKDHGSLEISNGLWNWHSQGIGGRNVVDYLIKVRGFGFVDAVRHLTGDTCPYKCAAPRAAQTKAHKPFKLTERGADNERVIAYLQRRGIAKPLIMGCIKRGSVYQSAQWCNCVFVGRDENGKARYATMRGTFGDFKRDIESSDKKYGFALPALSSHSDTVAVFESPVDALSHQSLYPNLDIWRLSLGSTAPAALTNFLERHGEVKKAIASTDNDDAGNRAAARIAKLEGIAVSRSIPPAGKDWNDALVAALGEHRPSLIGRLEAAKTIADERNALSAAGGARQKHGTLGGGDRKCRNR